MPKTIKGNKIILSWYKTVSIALLFMFLLLGSLSITIYFGETLKTNAKNAWMLKAVEEAESITNTCLFWFSIQQSQLRGIAALFNGSVNVTENEFHDAVEFMEAIDSIPFSAITFAEQVPLLSKESTQRLQPGQNQQYAYQIEMGLSSDGVIKPGLATINQAEILQAIQQAKRNPDQIIMSGAYRDIYDTAYISLLVSTINAGTPGIIIATININDFIEDLAVLHFIDGLKLRAINIVPPLIGQADKKVIWSESLPAEKVVKTFSFRVDSGQTHLEFVWDLQSRYSGGPAITLGNVVQITGSIIIIVLFVFIVYLLRENFRINQRVKTRTQELEVAKNKAEKATEVKAEFLANMSHEIRTPMNAIIGLADLCLKKSTSEEQRRHLEKVHDASHSLLNVINDILDYSKIEAGKLKMEVIPFSVEQVLENVVEMMLGLAEQKGLQLRYRILSRTSSFVNGDPQRLRQILTNLISNAIKFTEQGNVDVIYEVISCKNNTVTLQFSIIDTGIGMDEEQLQGLFTAFTQGDSSTTRLYGGTGLGLVICKQLLEQMQGDINVQSTKGQGSVFKFKLTLPVTDQVDIVAFHQQTADIAEIAELSGLHMLLVEDNEINQVVATALLKSEGISVDIAENGLQAITMLEKNSYDCVLMDIHMPVMDGYDATRKIRAQKRFERLPIIAMTANAMLEDRQHCLDVGMNDHLVKPIVPDLLYATLCKWLNKSKLTGVGKKQKETAQSSQLNITGIDTDAGLIHCGGDVQLYTKLLIKFVQNQQDTAEKINRAFQQGESYLALRLAHTIKGLAASIGAMSLHYKTRELEVALELKETDKVLYLLGVFTEELNKIVQAIKNSLLSEPVNNATSMCLQDAQITGQELHIVLKKLLDKLTSYDADADLFLENILQKNVQGDLSAALHAILKQINFYEYEVAANELNKVLGGLHEQ